MIILVIANACRTSGALSIYKQFINHLPFHKGQHKWYIIVDSSMPQPQIEGVQYIENNNHSWLNRIIGDKKQIKKITNKLNIYPDLYISLQNIGVDEDKPQIIYYHQSLPFYDIKWNIFKLTEIKLLLYKKFYPYFVKRGLNDQSDIVVQIPFIRRKFLEMFKLKDERMHVMFPDIENVDISAVSEYEFEDGTFNFIYPATGAEYKRHIRIIDAINIVKKHSPELASKIKVHFTINPRDNKKLYNQVVENSLSGQFVFHGIIPHERLMEMNKGCHGLLFPSIIETLGLPLLEAGKFGLPIIASDLNYSHEVLGDYRGATFVDSENSQEWADALMVLLGDKKRFEPIREHKSSWPDFFRLIDKRITEKQMS